MSGSLSATASNASLLNGTGSVGFTTTGSFTTMSGSVSTRVSQIESVYATTGSNSFRATQSITGSLTVTGQIIAQTLNVQQVTSSIIYSSGSNVFGCDINSRQTFTGSFFQTGSTSTFSSIVGIGGAAEAGWSLKSNGNLKVENTNGTTVLQVNDTSTGGKTWSLISSGAGNTHSVPAGTFYLRNSTDGITTLAVSGCGNIGIGTCIPQSIFHIGVPAPANAGAKSYTGLANSYEGLLFDYYYNTCASNLRLFDIVALGASTTGIGGSDIRFLTVPQTTTGTPLERLRITNCGNVGIGTSSPSAKFMVTSDTNTSATNIARFAAANNTLAIGIGYESIRQTETGGIIAFETNATERIRINSTGVTNFSCKMCILVPSGANEQDAIIIDKAGGFGQSFIRSYYANVPNYGMALRGGDGITAMYIQCQGYVGVGICTPSYKFHTVSPDNNTTSFAAFSALNLSQQVEMWYGGIRMGGSNTHVDMNLQSKGSAGVMNFITNGSTRMQIDGSGNIGAPSGTNIYNASDFRLKQNITSITDGLTKILGLNPVKFNWIDGFVPKENGKNMLGFIAQEVKTIVPEAVEEFNDGSTIHIEDISIENPLRVNEKFIIPVLTKAIQEQHCIICSQASMINTLKSCLGIA
jgi:hypothetical protein